MAAGTSEAESFLGEITRERTRPDAGRGRDWERAAVYGYARCGGSRALGDLLALHQRAGDSYRWLSLTALAATTSRPGVMRALDEMELLLEAGQGGDGAARAALATATTLVDASDPKALRELPVLREVHMMEGDPLVEASPDDLRASFYWTPENRAASTRDVGELAQRWNDEAGSIRERWASLID